MALLPFPAWSPSKCEHYKFGCMIRSREDFEQQHRNSRLGKEKERQNNKSQTQLIFIVTELLIHKMQTHVEQKKEKCKK